MLPALLAKIGLPLLIDAVAGALSGIDKPAAQAAAGALNAVGQSLRKGEVTPAQIAEARATAAISGSLL